MALDRVFQNTAPPLDAASDTASASETGYLNLNRVNKQETSEAVE